MINNEKLLKLLQDNARLSDDEIATMLDTDEKEVKQAIRALEKSGAIKSYRTVIDWNKTDIGYACAVIEVRVTPQRDTGFDEIAKRIMMLPEVESVYLMSGGYDLSIVVNAPTMSEVAMFVQKRLAPIGGILSTATHFVLTKYKDANTVFSSELDEIDERGSYLCD
ncbi:MAG: Lrp/AsnC family transcriptional regulator [Clostridia bacterium]